MVFENGKNVMIGLDLLLDMERICSKNRLFAPGAGIVIACSGGVDSIVLAHLLKRLSNSWKLRLCIAHFEHGIRGDESKEDADFVKGIADEWGIPFRMESGSVPEYAARKHLSIETAARELRYGFLRNVRNELGFDVIALAHHADDQAETALMRIIRGTGLGGLSAMRFRQDDLVRPMLSFRKADIKAYCETQGLLYREDATNAVPDVMRNRLRLELLPKLREEYNPAIDGSLCQLTLMAAEADDFLMGEAEKAWHDVVRSRACLELSGEALAKLHPAVQRVVLRKYLQQVFGDTRDLGFLHYDALRQLLLRGKSSARMELPHGRRVELSYGWLRPLSSDDDAFPTYSVNIPGITTLPEYGIDIVAELRASRPKMTTLGEFYCDFDRLPDTPVVRTRLPGDRITTTVGTKKLKDYFMDIKLERQQRDRQPLLACGQNVLWVIGHRRSALFQPDENTKNVLFLKIIVPLDSRAEKE